MEERRKADRGKRPSTFLYSSALALGNCAPSHPNSPLDLSSHPRQSLEAKGLRRRTPCYAFIQDVHNLSIHPFPSETRKTCTRSVNWCGRPIFHTGFYNSHQPPCRNGQASIPLVVHGTIANPKPHDVDNWPHHWTTTITASWIYHSPRPWYLRGEDADRPPPFPPPVQEPKVWSVLHTPAPRYPPRRRRRCSQPNPRPVSRVERKPERVHRQPCAVGDRHTCRNNATA